MRCLLYALLGVGLIIPTMTQARPVSYPDGWTFIANNSGHRNSAYLHYSPTAKSSLGYKFEYWRHRDFALNAVQMNYLLKRWNEPDSQANLYFKSGIGVADGRAGEFDGETSPAAFVGFAVDREDRRHYISYRNRYTAAGRIDGFYQQSARVGWAPYKGDYGDLHTWLMFEVEHMPEGDDHFTFTPLVRLFKGFHLFEVGFSNHDGFLFNYIFRY